MQGGEIVVPKIPSINIIDLAKAMDKTKKRKIIGIRPGEKLHEILCTKDDARLTIEFKKHYIIMPTTNNFSSQIKKYKKNKITGEKGKFVKSDFQYDSGKNFDFLNIKEIQKLLKSTDK
jgi:UDP-N-acetylglucosamine 4,6-dehydratase